MQEGLLVKHRFAALHTPDTLQVVLCQLLKLTVLRAYDCQISSGVFVGQVDIGETTAVLDRTLLRIGLQGSPASFGCLQISTLPTSSFPVDEIACLHRKHTVHFTYNLDLLSHTVVSYQAQAIGIPMHGLCSFHELIMR
jgi:hypothetical protein